MENKSIDSKEVISYNYYNSEHQYCVVLNVERLKEIFKADKIYLQEPREDFKNE